jgi:hypothetical protein
MESVHLKFTEDALRAIAREAMLKIGRSGTAHYKNIMLEIMRDMPSQPNIKEVVISEDAVERNEPPIVVYTKAGESARGDESMLPATTKKMTKNKVGVRCVFSLPLRDIGVSTHGGAAFVGRQRSIKALRRPRKSGA